MHTNAHTHMLLSPSSLTKLQSNTSLQRLSARREDPWELIHRQMHYAQAWSDHTQFELSMHLQEIPFINVNDLTLKEQRTEKKKEGCTPKGREMWALTERMGLRAEWELSKLFFHNHLFLYGWQSPVIEQQAVAPCWRGDGGSAALSIVWWDYNNCFYGNKTNALHGFYLCFEQGGMKCRFCKHWEGGVGLCSPF